MAHVPKSMLIGAGAGGGLAYGWARRQGQTGKEAAVTAGKGALVGAAGGGAVGLGLSMRRRKAARKTIPAVMTVRELAKEAGRTASHAVEVVEGAAGPILGQAQHGLERRGREVGDAARTAVDRSEKLARKAAERSQKLARKASAGSEKLAEAAERSQRAAQKAAHRAAVGSQKLAQAAERSKAAAEKAAKKAAERSEKLAREAAERSKKAAERAAKETAERSRRAAKEAAERSQPLVEPMVARAKPVVKRAKPVAAKGAERVLEATRDASNGHRQPAGPANVQYLRKALDDAIANGRKIPYDKPLVTRIV